MDQGSARPVGRKGAKEMTHARLPLPDNLLAGKKSAKDKVEEFVEKDLGIDPAKLPLNPKQARIRANEIAQQRSCATIAWDGNSLGLKHVVLSNQQTTCPNCNGSDFTNARDIDDTKPEGWLYCYDCEDQGNTPYFEPVYPQTVVGEHDKDLDWNDFHRVWKALQAEFGYSFKVKQTYYGDPEVESVEQKFDPDPRKLKTGQTVRLQKHHIDADDEFVYAKVGGLFSDTDLCILPQMTPITDLSGWRVVEVL
jgi:hypothetical protein